MASVLTSACPCLPAQDVEATIAFYQGVLGFSRVSRYPEQGYAIVSRDDVELHFFSCADRKLAEASGAYVRVLGVDALHAGLKGKDVRATEPEERFYGMREFAVWDPNGNLIRFGEAILENVG